MRRLWGMLLAAPWRLNGATLGSSGEELAARWLKQRGYRILERNLKILDDEVDLIALDPDGTTLVIVEVKTRSDDACGTPEEAVGFVKQKRLARLAARLQQSKRYRDRTIRFDVVAILWPKGQQPTIKHIPAAFDSPV